MITFSIVRGASAGRTFTVESEYMTIGRSPLSDIALDDESASGRHAEVRKQGERYVLTDLKSTNGTWVNGRLVKQIPLYTGDEIQVGQTLLRYTDGTPPREVASKVINLVGDEVPGPTIHATVESSEDSALLNVPADLLDREELVAAHRNLAALYRVTAVLNSSVGLRDLFDRIITQVFRVTNAERACIMLIGEGTGRLVEQLARTRAGTPEDASITISHTIVNHVIVSGRGVLTADAPADARFACGKSIVLSNIHSAMCVPLRVKDDIIGIIYADNLGQSKPFSRSDLQLLTALGGEAGLAIENTMLYEANLRAERLAAVGQTIAGLSHYIKNILWCMQGGAQIVQRELDNGNLDGVRKGWSIVHRNESKIGDLVMNMLSYSTGRKPRYETTDLNEIVQDVVEMSSAVVADGKVDVGMDLDNSLPPVPLDRAGIHRSVLNLLMNAAEALEAEGGKITVSTGYDSDADKVRVTVADDGPGLAEEDIPRLFVPFVSTKGGRGTGLGLAVVRKTTEEHYGDVAAENRPEGGAAFTIRLPATLPKRDEETL